MKALLKQDIYIYRSLISILYSLSCLYLVLKSLEFTFIKPAVNQKHSHHVIQQHPVRWWVLLVFCMARCSCRSVRRLIDLSYRWGTVGACVSALLFWLLQPSVCNILLLGWDLANIMPLDFICLHFCCVIWNADAVSTDNLLLLFQSWSSTQFYFRFSFIIVRLLWLLKMAYSFQGW